MPHYSKNTPLGAVTPEAPFAPFAIAACQIDFSHHTPSQEVGIVGRDNFAGEFVSRRPAKSVIAALQLKIGITDSCSQQTNQSKTLGALRLSNIANRQTMPCEVNRQHWRNIPDNARL